MRISVSTNTRVYLYCSFLSLGGFLYGYNFGVLTGLLEMPAFREDFNITHDLDHLDGPVSTMMAGAFFGALVSGPLSDYIGRKALMCIGTVIFTLGSIMQAGTDSLDRLYGARATTGVSIGILTMVVPLYQSEIAPKELRGRLVSFQQFAITLGICVAYWVDFATFWIQGPASYRLPLGLQLIPAVVCLVGLSYIPQSPRYSIDKHHYQQALDTLSKIRGDGSPSHPDALMEFVEIKQTIVFEQQYSQSRSYWRLFLPGQENNQKRLLLGVCVQMFQQLTGINAILMYAPQIYQAAGLRGQYSTLLANGITGLINCLATIIAVIFIDKVGRRPTMIFGAIGCCICMVVMAIISGKYGYVYQWPQNPTDSPTSTSTGENGSLSFLLQFNAPAIAFIVMMYLFVASYASTWGAVGWIYPTELYSQGLRAKALGITTAANWLFNFGVLRLTPAALTRIEWKTYLVFGIFCAAIAVAVYFFFPETMGKSLEEVDLIFFGNFHYYDTKVHHPQTAAAALEQMEKMQREKGFQFAFDGAVCHFFEAPRPASPIHLSRRLSANESSSSHIANGEMTV